MRSSFKLICSSFILISFLTSVEDGFAGNPDRERGKLYRPPLIHGQDHPDLGMRMLHR